MFSFMKRSRPFCPAHPQCNGKNIFLGIFFIVSVELPDCKHDAATGKRTLAVRVGRMRALIIATLGAAATAAAFLVIAVFRPDVGSFFAIAALASALPLIAGILGVFLVRRGVFAIEKITETNMQSLILFSCILAGYLVFWS